MGSDKRSINGRHVVSAAGQKVSTLRMLKCKKDEGALVGRSACQQVGTLKAQKMYVIFRVETSNVSFTQVCSLKGKIR